MASQALRTWHGSSAERLDQLLAAHAAVGGTAPGRRWATEQLNAAILVQVAALFQLYCRDLFSEAGEVLIADLPVRHRPSFRTAVSSGRPLRRGNATASEIAASFGRLDIEIWALAASTTRRTIVRRSRLEQLNIWRNAIAHQDFSLSDEQRRVVAGTACTLVWARRWRTACDGLAQTFDTAVAERLSTVVGSPPW